MAWCSNDIPIISPCLDMGQTLAYFGQTKSWKLSIFHVRNFSYPPDKSGAGRQKACECLHISEHIIRNRYIICHSHIYYLILIWILYKWLEVQFVLPQNSRHVSQCNIRRGNHQGELPQLRAADLFQRLWRTGHVAVDMGAVATAKPLWVNYLYCHWLYLLVYRRKFRSQTSRQYGQMKSRAGQRQREEKLCFSNDLWLRRVEE